MKQIAYFSMVAFSLLMFSQCKKAEADLTVSKAFAFKNNTDKSVRVNIYTSLGQYKLGRDVKDPVYGFVVTPNTEYISTLKRGSFYIDWYSTDYEYSNWGADISTASTETTPITFTYSETSLNYTIDKKTATRISYLDTLDRMTWRSRVALTKNGENVDKVTAVELITNRDYSVTIKYNYGRVIPLKSNTFGSETTLLDSANAKYEITIAQASTRKLDTLVIKLPFTDTVYKLIKVK